MLLYLTIILISVVLLGCGNATFSSLGFGEAFAWVGIGTAVMFAIDAVVAAIVHALPASLMRPFAKFYTLSPRERKLYEKLGVRVWKDLIPESGKYLCHFAKDRVEQPDNNEYVLRFLNETCYAELMHSISAVLGFVPVFFLPYSLNIMLPVALVNALLQLLPVMTQRYNRSRLVTLYRYNERKQSRMAAKERENT